MSADPTTPAPNPYAAACASSELLLSPEEERAAYTRQLYARLAAERAHALRSGKLVKLFSALPWPDLYADLPPREARAPQLFDLMYDPALLYACRNDQGPPLAYALAHIRRGPYYYDVAPGLHALRMHQQALMREQERQVGARRSWCRRCWYGWRPTRAKRRPGRGSNKCARCRRAGNAG